MLSRGVYDGLPWLPGFNEDESDTWQDVIAKDELSAEVRFTSTASREDRRGSWSIDAIRTSGFGKGPIKTKSSS